MPELKDFSLVGGTCLSLRYGHRKSIDLDLFASTDFSTFELNKILENKIAGFSARTINAVGIFAYISDVKVDLIKYHHYDKIGKETTTDDIRMYSDQDIMAMKVFAVLNRGQKKDFWDIAELLHYYSVEDFIESYTSKFPNHQVLISIPQAMIYFDDAEESEEPVSLKSQNWTNVKMYIREKVNAYLR